MNVVPEFKQKSRHAITHWEVLEEFKNYTLLKLNLETGRTHQIRVHLAYLNRPIVGDPVYGNKNTQVKTIQRQCLHSKEITFTHPITGEILFFESELPEDIKSLLDSLLNK